MSMQIDHNKKSVSEAMGINEERKEELKHYLTDLVMRQEKTSKRLEDIGEGLMPLEEKLFCAYMLAKMEDQAESLMGILKSLKKAVSDES